jgi:hypothetical protein
LADIPREAKPSLHEEANTPTPSPDETGRNSVGGTQGERLKGRLDQLDEELNQLKTAIDKEQNILKRMEMERRRDAMYDEWFELNDVRLTGGQRAWGDLIRSDTGTIRAMG